MTSPFRDQIVARLKADLVGPLAPDEVIPDRPSQRYSTGILYPRGSRLEPQEDEDGGLAVNVNEDATSAPEDPGVSLHMALKPSVVGLSFAVDPSGDSEPIVTFDIVCAVYKRFSIDSDGREKGSQPCV